MNKEEIKHFKAMLRQGSLRHMNILLDDKFQKELLNIIKDYEKLKQENNQLKEELRKADSLTQSCIFDGKEESQLNYRKAINIIKELRNLLAEYLCSEEYCGEVGNVTTKFVEDLGNILNELEGDKNE